MFPAIAAFHVPLSKGPLGRHQLVVRFLHGTWRMRLVAHARASTWDLAVVTKGLPQFLTFKVASFWLLSPLRELWTFKLC